MCSAYSCSPYSAQNPHSQKKDNPFSLKKWPPFLSFSVFFSFSYYEHPLILLLCTSLFLSKEMTHQNFSTCPPLHGPHSLSLTKLKRNPPCKAATPLCFLVATPLCREGLHYPAKVNKTSRWQESGER